MLRIALAFGLITCSTLAAPAQNGTVPSPDVSCRNNTMDPSSLNSRCATERPRGSLDDRRTVAPNGMVVRDPMPPIVIPNDPLGRKPAFRQPAPVFGNPGIIVPQVR